MKINQVLVESAGATVAFAFGRFNPAHQGHIEVWRAVEDAGANWFIGTNPSTLGPNDPLTFQQKSAWMEEIYPPIAGHIVPEQSVLTLAAYIFKKLRKNERATVAYITDAQDWAWSGKLLNQYNGVEGAHGYYKFAQITHVPSPRVSSATALRDAARADDRVAFYHASGTDPKLKVAGLSYFDTVKQACEKYPLPVKKAKKVKEEQGVSEAIQPGVDTLASVKKLWQYVNRNLTDLASMASFYDDRNELYIEERLDNLLKTASGAPVKVGFDMGNTIEMHGNILLIPIGMMWQLRRIYDARTFVEKVMTALQGPAQQSVAESEQKTVAKTWDQMTPKEKISGVKGRTVWNEKTKKYYTVFDVPVKQETDEASLSTMRDFFAGDDKARDPYEITKQRLYYDPKAVANKRKEFKSQYEYDQWLRKHNLKQISGVKEDEEAGEVKQQVQLIPFPQGTTKVAVSDVYDWYKLGQVISDLDDADPADFGQGAPETVIAFGSEEEEHKLLPLLQRLGLKLKDIDQPVGEAYHAGSLYEMLKKERTKNWTLTNKRK